MNRHESIDGSHRAKRGHRQSAARGSRIDGPRHQPQKHYSINPYAGLARFRRIVPVKLSNTAASTREILLPRTLFLLAQATGTEPTRSSLRLRDEPLPSLSSHSTIYSLSAPPPRPGPHRSSIIWNFFPPSWKILSPGLPWHWNYRVIGATYLTSF